MRSACSQPGNQTRRWRSASATLKMSISRARGVARRSARKHQGNLGEVVGRKGAAGSVGGNVEMQATTRSLGSPLRRNLWRRFRFQGSSKVLVTQRDTCGYSVLAFRHAVKVPDFVLCSSGPTYQVPSRANSGARQGKSGLGFHFGSITLSTEKSSFFISVSQIPPPGAGHLLAGSMARKREELVNNWIHPRRTAR
jgi:hypothetical protein